MSDSDSDWEMARSNHGEEGGDASEGNHTDRNERRQQRWRRMELRIRKDMMAVVQSTVSELQKAMEQKLENMMARFEEKWQPEARGNAAGDENIDEGNKEAPERRAWRNEHNWAEQSERTTVRKERLRFAKLDCILTKETDYALWRDKVRAEILANGCLFIIDRNAIDNENRTGEEIDKMKMSVRSFIISNLDESYHRLVKNYQDPAEMMVILDQAGEPTGKHMEYSLRKQFGDLKYDPGIESAIEFLAKFDDLLAKIRRCSDMDDRQAKTNLLMAIETACPSIHIAEMATKEGLTIEEIKAKMFEEESRTKELRRREDSTSTVAMYSRPNTNEAFRRNAREYTCYRCGQLGHHQGQCTSVAWKCYCCQQMTADHVAENCPRRPSKQKTQNRPPARKGEAPVKSGRKQESGVPRRRLKKVPLARAEKIAKQRAHFGRAHLMIFEDDDSENLPYEKKDCWIDADDLMEDEKAMLLYAATEGEETQKRGSDGTAFSTFDGKHSLGTGKIKFIVDSGATDHVANDRGVFVNIRKLEKTKRIVCANGSKEADLIIEEVGDIFIKNDHDGKIGCLTNVLYAPGLVENLFALRKLTNGGLMAKFTKNQIIVEDETTGEEVKTGNFSERFWWLEFSLPLAEVDESERESLVERLNCLRLGGRQSQKRALVLDDDQTGGSGAKYPRVDGLGGEAAEGGEASNVGSDRVGEEQGETSTERNEEQNMRDNVGLLWHLRLNHCSKRYLETAAKVVPEMKNVMFGSDIMDCLHCKLAKAKRKPCNEVRHRAEVPFQRLHSDLMGAIKPCALRSGARYIATFTDDSTRFAMAYPIGDKTQMHVALANCLSEIRRLNGAETRVLELRTDGGMEYRTHAMKSLLEREGITLKACEPSTPEHNAVSERLNLEIEEKIRVNLISAKMPNCYWAHALSYVMHVHNRTPNSSIEFKTPYELVLGHAPRLRYLRRFGCEAYVFDHKAKAKSKFAPRARIGFLLECNETGYTILDAAEKTLIRSKHVDFNESKVFGDRQGCDDCPLSDETLTFEERLLSEPEQNVEEQPGPSHKSRGWLGEMSGYDLYESDGSDNEVDGEALLSAVMCEEPKTYAEAFGRSDWANWEEAIKDEFDALHKCETWKIVPRNEVPSGMKVIRARWVNKRKLEANGSIRYRSRLVAKGFGDTNEYDRTEIYAPVARLADVRFLLIIANKMDLELKQFDVKTAFLNGKLEKTVYMEIPEGLKEYMNEGDGFQSNYVCKLQRALYGLKVSPKRWFVRFQEAMQKMGFTVYEFQQCMFTWREGEEFAIILLYVDDILCGTNSKKKLAEIRLQLKNEFKITELGEPKKFLGLEIVRNREERTLLLHQKVFAESIVRRFGLEDAKAAETPMATRDSERTVVKTVASVKCEAPYRQAIGSLLYLQNGTRPDITYAVNVLSRKQGSYSSEDWVKVKRVLRYVKGSLSQGLMFRGEDNELRCYPDASLGLNDEAGQSTSGYVIKLFGDAICWRTKKQNHVALSSAESEYVAMSLACRELANIREMCRRTIRLELLPILYEDNKAAIELAKTEESSTLKHLVNLCYHYVRGEIRQNRVCIEWINSKDQLGDFFTKALPRDRFLEFRSKIMSCDE